MRRNDKNAGSALIILLGVMVVLAILIGIATTTTQFQARITQRTRTQVIAAEAADGALEMLFSGWRKICSTSSVEAPPTQAFDTEIPLPDTTSGSSYFPNLPSLTASRSYQANPAPNTLSNLRVQAVTPLLETMGTSNAADPDLTTLADTASPAQSTGPGTGTYSYYYLASADVTLPSISGKTLTAKVRRVFEKRITSPWNWALFFNNDLEIHPSTPLTLNGWVHTNGNLYTGSDKLTVTDRMTYVGDWSIGWAPGDAAHTAGTALAPNTPSDLPPGNDQNYLPFGWSLDNLLNTTDTNPNNDSYHEVIERPVSGQTDPLANQRFYNQAGVKILIDASNNLTIINAAGTVVTALSKGADLALYNAFKGAISTNRSFQDNREQANVRVADLDISYITSKYPSTGGSGFNGVVYIADTSASQTGGTPKRGIRLVNGASLPSGGLTVVSENPIYIKGDYNTGGTPASDGILGLQPDPTKPTVSGYAAQPAAIIADAVTLVSRNFSDSNSGGNLSNRPAINTTINAAILAGIVPSGANGSNYSGGAENFIRLLEDWTGKNITCYGSMVQFYLSQQGTGIWGSANVYKAGTLNLYFDSNLLTTSPPGTATTVAYLQQQRWFMVY
jgi:type II secretory pathway pseudopilin PulG